MSEHLDRAFAPATLGKLPLKNRIIKAATYEGKTPDGIPGAALLDFHRQIVEGGTAMTTIGYCTTEADGRINDQMMWLHEDIRDRLVHMNSELKKAAEIHPRNEKILLNIHGIAESITRTEKELVEKIGSIVVFHFMRRIFANLYFQEEKGFFFSDKDYKLSEFTFVKYQGEIEEIFLNISRNIPSSIID